MPVSTNMMLHHAGITHDDLGLQNEGSLYEHIWQLRKRPDDILILGCAQALDDSLKEFLLISFELVSFYKNKDFLYSFSRIGTTISITSASCGDINAMRAWLRLRVILDISLDAIFAGDMQPLEEMIGYELLGNGIVFHFR